MNPCQAWPDGKTTLFTDQFCALTRQWSSSQSSLLLSAHTSVAETHFYCTQPPSNVNTGGSDPLCLSNIIGHRETRRQTFNQHSRPRQSFLPGQTLCKQHGGISQPTGYTGSTVFSIPPSIPPLPSSSSRFPWLKANMALSISLHHPQDNLSKRL